MKPWEMYSSNSSQEDKKPWELYSSQEPEQDPLSRMSELSATSTGLSGNTEYTSFSTPTANNDGTISTIATGQPDDYTGSFNKDVVNPVIEGAGQTVAGARRFTSGTAKVINDTLEKAGLPNEKENTDNAVQLLADYTDRYNAKHPDQAIHPSTIGELAMFAAVPIKNTMVAGGAGIGAISFLDSIGANKNYDEAVKDGIINAVIGGASIGVLNKLFNVGSKELPRDTKILLKLNQNRITPEAATKLLKDIPKEDRTISLAESLDLAKNYFKSAIGDDSILATKYGTRLEARKNMFKPFVADAKEVADVKLRYGKMKEELDQIANGVHSTEGIQSKLNDKLVDVYATDPSGIGTTLKRIKADTTEPITVSQALDIRENINELLRKPSVKKSFKMKQALTDVKTELDSFMDVALPSETRTNMLQTINAYKETMNRAKLGEILSKNTKSKYAVNWAGALNDINKEGLVGKNTDFVVPILKEFEKKFSNDKFMGEVINAAGKSKPLSWLGGFSAVIGKAYDILSPIVNRSRYKDILIRKAIIKSIKRMDSQSPLKFVDDLVKNKTITLEKANEIKKAVGPELKQLEYNPFAKTTGNINHKPLYSTSEGTVSTDATEAALHDSQVKLVKEALGKGYDDKVIDKTAQLLNSKRVEKVIKTSVDRMKVGETMQNAQMLDKIIKGETDKLVKLINKDHGVKLPPQEVEKLYKMRLKKLVEDCK